MDVGGHAFSQHRWCTRILQKHARAKIFHSLRVGIKTPWENCPTLGEKPKQLATRNNGDKKEMRRKERQIKTFMAQNLELRMSPGDLLVRKPGQTRRFSIIGTLRQLLWPAPGN